MIVTKRARIDGLYGEMCATRACWGERRPATELIMRLRFLMPMCSWCARYAKQDDDSTRMTKTRGLGGLGGTRPGASTKGRAVIQV